MIVYLMSLLNKMFEPLVTVAHYETPLHPIKKVWWIEKIVNGLNSLSSM
ncbi:beta-glucosidase/6-phospho-beta-glucosidase/beta-galactosidase [Amphibacillus cookii]|nr:beta-glucosidase/6-phospho-beta-glucosidase/beta-galactosidase [Amphibacillus cookii]